MRKKPKPGDRTTKHKQIAAPAAPSKIRQRLGKRQEEPEPDSNLKLVRAVVRTVSEGALVHVYLACGHLITVQRGDLKNAAPTEMECWACDMWKAE